MISRETMESLSFGVTASPPEVSTLEDGQSEGGREEGALEMEVLHPEHPLLHKFQQSLTQTLLEERERIQLKLNALEQELKESEALKRKLDLANYKTQQALAREEAQVQALRKENETRQRQRAEYDNQLSEDQQALEELHNQVNTAVQREAELQKELASILEKRASLGREVEEREAQLLAHRSFVQKCHKERQTIDGFKTAQDLLVTKLLSEIDYGEWSTHQARLEVLREEEKLGLLRDALRAAQTEWAAAQCARKRLRQAWQSSLMDLERRQTASLTMQQSLKEKRSQLESNQLQLERLRKDAAVLAAEKSTKLLSLERTEKAFQRLSQTREQSQAAEIVLKQELYNKTALLTTLETQLESLAKEDKLFERSEEDINRQLREAEAKKSRLQENVVEILRQKLLADQEAQNAYRQIQQLRETSRTRDLKLANLENTLARLALLESELQECYEEKARTLAHVQQKLEEDSQKFAACQAELVRAKKTLSQRENQVARLQRKIAELQIQKQSGPNDYGQHQIATLQDSIGQLTKEIEHFQHNWLQSQNQLLTLSQDQQVAGEYQTTLGQELLVLEQAKIARATKLTELKGQKNLLEKKIPNLRVQMTQLCAAIANEKQTRAALEYETKHWNREWQAELETPERELLQLTRQKLSLQEESEALQLQICEAEKSAALWETKLFEIREARALVDAETSDAGQIAALKAEIHRQQVREAQLTRTQEQMSHELEKCVLGRAILKSKAECTTPASVRTKAVDKERSLKRDIKTSQKELQASNNRLDDLQRHYTTLRTDLEQRKCCHQETQERLHYLRNKQVDLLAEKRQVLTQLALVQKRLKFYEALKRGSYKPIYNQRERLMAQTKKTDLQLTNLKEAVGKLAQDYQLPSDQFRPVLSLLELDLTQQ